jgi:Sortase and related acyltransferases
MNIRRVTLDDAESICKIYNYYVENTAVTFETKTVTVGEMKQRIAGFLNEGFPYYVGEAENKIMGYCYLHDWNSRRAYSLTKEVSIYMDKGYTGKGLGTLLYRRLFDEIYRMDIHVIIAGICIPNEKSVRLHEKFGLKQVSHMREVGRKLGKWHDVGHWQLVINRDISLV